MTKNKETGWVLVAKGPNNEDEELWRLKVSGGWIVKQYSKNNVCICFVPTGKKFVDVNILED